MNLSLEKSARKGYAYYRDGSRRPIIWAHRRDIGQSSLQMKGFWLVFDEMTKPRFRYEALGSTWRQVGLYLGQMPGVVIERSYSLKDVRTHATELAGELASTSRGVQLSLDCILSNLLPGISRDRAKSLFFDTIGV